jgi:hypothetical protein
MKNVVIPAKAGIHLLFEKAGSRWIPASAGMTAKKESAS